MREQTVALAKALGVVGLINVQYAIKDGVVYVLEVNPRASRTIPFVSKAIGVPLASLAARVMVGETLDDIGFTEEIVPPYVSVKEAVFPFNKFRGHRSGARARDALDGRSAWASPTRSGRRSRRRSSRRRTGCRSRASVLITVIDSDKPTVTPIARRFHEMGFEIVATAGTAAYLRARGIPAQTRVQGARGAAELPRHDRESRRRSCSSTRRWASTRSWTTTCCARRRS